MAARLGVPVETARSRVRRGLALLRERLDREHDGDRGAWTAMLLPLAGVRPRVPVALAPPGRAALWPLGKAAAWLAALSAAAALFGWLPLGDGARDAAVPAATDAPAPGSPALLASGPEPEARGPAALSHRAAGAVAALPAAPLSGRVLDARTGEPVPEIAVRLAPAAGLDVVIATDRAGRFATPDSLALGPVAVMLLDGPDRLAVEVAPRSIEHDGAPHELAAAIGPTFRLGAPLPAGVPREEWVFWLRQEGSRSNGGGDWRVHLRGEGEPWARLPAMPRLSLLEGGARSRFAVGVYSGDRRWLGEAEVDALPGVHAEPLALAFSECGRIAGTLRGAGGAPLPGELVELRVPDEEQPVLHARTGADGRYVLGPVRPGEWICAARAPRHAELARPVELAAGEEVWLELPLEALPTASVEGRLTSATGRHVPRGAVRLRAADDPARELTVLPRVLETESGVEARFRFADVAPGTWVLLPPAGDFLPWEPARIEVSAPALGLELRCRDDVPTFDVAFAPRDAATGAVVEDVRGYLVVDLAREGRARAVALRDPEPVARPLDAGEVAFAGVPEGCPVYWLVEADGYRAVLGDTSALVGAGSLRTVEVALERTWRARFSVVHAGAGGTLLPLPGAEVVTAGGTVLGAANAKGELFLELSYDPGPIDVRLPGWRCASVDGFAEGRLFAERDPHVARMVPR